MKTLLILSITLFSFQLMSQEMRAYSRKTDSLISVQEYEEALERVIWWHENVLNYERSMMGVRLSFSLGTWLRLGQEYPQALQAFLSYRDTGTQLIETTGGNDSIFKDVSAFNRTLKENYKTIALFKHVEKNHADSAPSYWPIVKRDLFDAKDYETIATYFSDPVEEYEKIAEFYNKSLIYMPEKADERLKAYVRNHFVEEVLQVMDYSKSIGDTESTMKIQELAFAVVEDERIKMAFVN